MEKKLDEKKNAMRKILVATRRAFRTTLIHLVIGYWATSTPDIVDKIAAATLNGPSQDDDLPAWAGGRLNTLQHADFDVRAAMRNFCSFVLRWPFDTFIFDIRKIHRHYDR